MGTVLVTGAAGFLGSHLVDLLLEGGCRVVGVDDLSTGRLENLAPALVHPAFTFVRADAARPPPGAYTRIYHLACPASPVDFVARQAEILHACGPATQALLALSRRVGARFLLASSSEVYGEPDTHPQTEASGGFVDPRTPRAVYALGKRAAEAEALAAQGRGAEVRIARLFNSYGPRMRPDDGRVVVQFLTQALAGEPLTVHGDGSQTRSLCYCTDTVRGLVALMESELPTPCNLGRAEEVTVAELAHTIRALTGSRSRIVHTTRPAGDPSRRRPCTRTALDHLGFTAQTALQEGLVRTLRALVAQERDYSRNCTPPTAPMV